MGPIWVALSRNFLPTQAMPFPLTDALLSIGGSFGGRLPAAMRNVGRDLKRTMPFPRQGAEHTGENMIHGNEKAAFRSEEHTSELQSLMRISYAVFCLKKKKQTETQINKHIRLK